MNPEPRTVSKEQFKENIIAFFQEQTGMSIQQGIDKIKSELVIDKWGNTENDSIKASNVRLFYTNNVNYQQGEKNNGGKGFYLSNAGFTGGGVVKL